MTHRPTDPNQPSGRAGTPLSVADVAGPLSPSVSIWGAVELLSVSLSAATTMPIPLSASLGSGSDEPIPAASPDMTAAATEPQAEPVEPTWLVGLFNDCRAELLGLLTTLLGQSEDAWDAFQETFLKCWRHQRDRQTNEPPIRNPRAWVFQVAANTARDFRKGAWQRRRCHDTTHLATTPATQPTAEEELAACEERERVRYAIAELRPELQLVFLMRQNGGLKYEEIACQLQLPLGTVKTRMRTALQQLTDALRDPN